MNAEAWEKVRDVLHEALKLAPEERSGFLDRVCPADDPLRSEVESLLRSGDEIDSTFLQPLAIDLMLKRGTRLGDYEVESLLGSGGMGEVYQARDLRLHRSVAIKVLPSVFSLDRDRLQRFEQEARAAAALNHPNIIAVFQLGTYQSSPYLVSELLEGLTLREHLRQGPIELDRAVDYCLQIADGLAAAHGKGIVHRDLKPENLMVTPDERIKILDFGLAKLSGPTFNAVTLDVATNPGTVMGTLGYMSPEQALGKNLDLRTDLFSLGAVFYEMVTGRRAFEGGSSAAVYDAILNRTPTPPRQLNPDLPPQIENIVSKAIEKNRDLRYQVAPEIRTDLRRLKRDMDSGYTTSASAAADVTRKAVSRRRIRLLIASAIFVLFLAAGVFYRFWPRSQDAPELKVRQLTRNSSENSVGSGGISPDGKYLAYADVKGMHIQLVATGEILEVPQPEVFKHIQVNWQIFGGWLPDSTRFIANARINQSNFSWNAQDSSIWIVSLIGAPRKLRDAAGALSVSPDGSWIAFGTEPVGGGEFPAYREIWLMRPDGDQAHKQFSADENFSINNVLWSSDGKRLAYLKSDKSGTPLAIDTRGLGDEPTTEILRVVASAPLLGFLWLPDGRIAYDLTEPTTGVPQTCVHWQIRIDPRTGQPIGRSQRMANWFPDCPSYTSFTADGEHVAFLRGTGQYTIYVADLDANGTRITPPKRLTLNESHNIPSGWTPDNKTVIFVSDLNGPKGIFQQSIEEQTAHPVFTQPGIEGAARPTPDGSSLIYRVSDPTSEQRKLMQIPLMGGVPQMLLVGNFVNGGARCARLPSTVCAIAERSPDRKHLVFTSVDPLKGRGDELKRFDTDPGRNLDYFWDLSPEGTRLALLNSTDPTILILSLAGQPTREIALNGWHGLGYTSWTPDGKRLIVGSQDNRSATLLSVGIDGDVHPLWEQDGAFGISGIPSPDGHHIAIWLSTKNKNFWIADNI
jgi:eukaryotic-like serine/threonine-protein kinase